MVYAICSRIVEPFTIIGPLSFPPNKKISRTLILKLAETIKLQSSLVSQWNYAYQLAQQLIKFHVVLLNITRNHPYDIEYVLKEIKISTEINF